MIMGLPMGSDMFNYILVIMGLPMGSSIISSVSIYLDQKWKHFINKIKIFK